MPAIEREPTALPPSATATDGGRAPAGATPALGPGTVLAHFQIDALLGRGGMGEVYRATDLALDRAVALKVLPAAAQDDPGRRERLAERPGALGEPLERRGRVGGAPAWIALVLWAAWARADKRALWDRVAGTMVRYRR